MTRVLVTGSRGLLGATLMKVLPELGLEVKGLEGDIRFPDEIDREVALYWPQLVVHCAAKTSVPGCEKDPVDAFNVNARGCERIVNAAKIVGAKIIYISTASVFSGEEGNYKETDIPSPLRVYDQSKREGELFVLDYKGGMVLRLNLIGIHPEQTRVRNFLEWLVDAFKNNRDITLFDNVFINPVSNFTAADFISSWVQHVQSTPRKILHIGSTNVVTKAQIGRLVAAHFPKYQGKITAGNSTDQPKQMWLNTDLVQSMGFIMPTVGFEVLSCM